jgi:hypothetical protein
MLHAFLLASQVALAASACSYSAVVGNGFNLGYNNPGVTVRLTDSLFINCHGTPAASPKITLKCQTFSLAGTGAAATLTKGTEVQVTPSTTAANVLALDATTAVVCYRECNVGCKFYCTVLVVSGTSISLGTQKFVYDWNVDDNSNIIFAKFAADRFMVCSHPYGGHTWQRCNQATVSGSTLTFVIASSGSSGGASSASVQSIHTLNADQHGRLVVLSDTVSVYCASNYDGTNSAWDGIMCVQVHVSATNVRTTPGAELFMTDLHTTFTKMYVINHDGRFYNTMVALSTTQFLLCYTATTIDATSADGGTFCVIITTSGNDLVRGPVVEVPMSLASIGGVRYSNVALSIAPMAAADGMLLCWVLTDVSVPGTANAPTKCEVLHVLNVGQTTASITVNTPGAIADLYGTPGNLLAPETYKHGTANPGAYTISGSLLVSVRANADDNTYISCYGFSGTEYGCVPVQVNPSCPTDSPTSAPTQSPTSAPTSSVYVPTPDGQPSGSGRLALLSEQATIAFGSAGDVALYRSGAGWLKASSNFEVVGQLVVGGVDVSAALQALEDRVVALE